MHCRERTACRNTLLTSDALIVCKRPRNLLIERVCHDVRHGGRSHEQLFLLHEAASTWRTNHRRTGVPNAVIRYSTIRSICDLRLGLIEACIAEIQEHTQLPRCASVAFASLEYIPTLFILVFRRKPASARRLREDKPVKLNLPTFSMIIIDQVVDAVTW